MLSLKYQAREIQPSLFLFPTFCLAVLKNASAYCCATSPIVWNLYTPSIKRTRKKARRSYGSLRALLFTNPKTHVPGSED